MSKMKSKLSKQSYGEPYNNFEMEPNWQWKYDANVGDNVLSGRASLFVKLVADTVMQCDQKE